MFKLINCGYNYIHSDGIMIDRPNGSGNYAFVLFRSKAMTVVEGRSMPIEKDMWVIFRPGTSYSYLDIEKPFVNDWFHFGGEDTECFLKSLDLPLDEPILAIHPASISRGIMELQSMNWQEGPLREQIIDLDLQSLLMKLSNSRQTMPASENTARYFRQFSEIRNMLYSFPQTKISVEALAAEVNLSKSYFQHIYKELFRCPVSFDMINGRLEYAKYLLENSSLSISAVSKMCGYENETHFMRQFKQFVELTPSHYRSNLRNRLKLPAD